MEGYTASPQRASYVPGMIQSDLFAAPLPLAPPPPNAGTSACGEVLNLPAILDRLSACCQRPCYGFTMLNLIAQAGGVDGATETYVRDLPVHDWLCDALLPLARRDSHRRVIKSRVQRKLAQARALLADAVLAEKMGQASMRERVRQSCRFNVNRAISELMRAGLVTRHYLGWRLDHENRGAQRQAVYTLAAPVRAVFWAGSGSATLSCLSAQKRW
jgi:hypothetical protein